MTAKDRGAPVKNAIITVTSDDPDEDEPPFTATTDANGEYSIKPISTGDYKIIAKAFGFKDFEDDALRIKLGDVNHFDIQMSK